MAFQTRGGDPLFDSDMQAAIEKRGKELVGVLLFAAGVVATLAFATYSPDDPSWLSVTDGPVQNLLGRVGAGLSAPFFMILGLGGWGFAILALVWGLRLGLHRGTDNALSRLVFAPIWIVLLSVFAASLVPGSDWSHSFGLGGLFGDTVLGTMLGVSPLDASAGLKALSLVTGLAVALLGLYVLGATPREGRLALRLVVYAVIMAYVGIRKLMGQGAKMSWAAAIAAHRTGQVLHQRHREASADRAVRRAERAEAAAFAAAEAEAAAAEAARYAPEPEYAAPAPAPTIRERLTGIVRRAGGHDTSYDEPYAYDVDDTADVEAWEAYQADQRAAAAPVAPARQPAPVLAAPRRAPEPQAVPAEPPMHRRPTPAQPGPRLGGVTRVTAYEEVVEEDEFEESAPKPGFLSRLPAMIRRPEKSQMPAGFVAVDDDLNDASGLPVDDRIKAKIADAVRQRARTSSRLSAPTHQPVTRGRGRGPDPLILGHRAEPPVTSAQAAVAPQPRVAAPAPAPVAEPELVEEDVYYAAGDEAYDEADYGHEAEDMPMAEAPAPVMQAPLPHAEPARRVVQPAMRKAPAPSTRAKAEAQPQLKFEEPAVQYELPPLNLLMDPSGIKRHHLSDEALEENARMLESVLDDYGVKGEIVSVRPGPVVTMYELEPAPGLKASRVIGLADDIARSMSALSARVSTVPGRSVIGIELPNDNREMVVLREILAAREFGDSHMKLPLALGKDIGGGSVVANLAKMPHLLIAGTTGSGKSVAINTMILSLLYRLTPEDCRLIMIDPKMLELSVYDGIPHLLSPVVTDPKKAVVALKWTVGEMEDRYRKMSKMGVRNIDGYNGRVADALAKGETFKRTVQTGFDDETGEPVFETEETVPEKMPYIVVIVDEMADLMMVAGKEIEACIQRLAQMARASGIHLIMATQRPSVDVITGTIKANFPTRISFQVTSKIDSRTILGEMGAEQLLGQGDMLYMAGGAKIQRCHGPFVSDEEVEEIVNHLKAYGPPDYHSGVVEGPDEDAESDIDLVLGLGGNTNGEDALYDQAVAVVIKDRKCSTSYIQRKLGIGYNKAARLVEQMEEEGLVSPANHVGKREILVPEQ
ncbi:cell division protein FtsK [Oceanicola sp. 22II-s10i]|uniref:DNA translocase FtsK n=1 Tax=Oceanicola sp. 22II-s10i TaxID=1317116 RepID=UPI000B527AD7|nr:DNA translocase FtsK [Oceanicola sp. 22II-s10i]OWU85521.1 cell division protein FtsK [Oceanicola sp. 22II-s10i]